MKLEIAAAALQHVPALAALERECFSRPWSGESLLCAIEDPAYFVFCAFADGMLAGYISVRTVLNEGYVNNLAVTRAFRRRGVGRALVKEALTDAAKRNLSFLSLEVRASNTPAIALYESLGFHKEGLRRGFYTAPKEDAWIMTAHLPERNETHV